MKRVTRKGLEKDLNHFSTPEVMRAHFGENMIYIPDNNYGIRQDYYDLSDLVDLLRSRRAEPDAIGFIADMPEV